MRFIERLADEGPTRFAALFDLPAGVPGRDTMAVQSQFFRSFGWAIASAMPLPAQGYAARKLPLPGRNEPCICGSLRKFKHCCAPLFEHPPAREPVGLGAVMLLEVTKLLGTGQRARAAERADQITVFEKMGRGEFPPIPGLDTDDDEPGRADIVGVLEPDSPFQQFERWAEGLPSPRLRLDLKGATPQDLDVLVPAAAMAVPLARWRKAFDLQLPEAAWQTLGPEAMQVFVDERWSALLQRELRLADRFEVLDGLQRVLETVPMGLAAGLQARLLNRGLDLWRPC